MSQESKKIGKKFGRLTVLETVRVQFKNKGRQFTHYKCLCDCGNTVITSLINAKSCGCLQKELVAARSKKELGFAAKTAVWNYYKRNAITRNVSWNLSRAEFDEIVVKNCHYCKVTPESLWITPEGDGFCRSGVDRIDSSKGYELANCVPCCKICNRAKNNLPLEVFLTWISRLKDGT